MVMQARPHPPNVPICCVGGGYARPHLPLTAKVLSCTRADELAIPSWGAGRPPSIRPDVAGRTAGSTGWWRPGGTPADCSCATGWPVSPNRRRGRPPRGGTTGRGPALLGRLAARRPRGLHDEPRCGRGAGSDAVRRHRPRMERDRRRPGWVGLGQHAWFEARRQPRPASRRSSSSTGRPGMSPTTCGSPTAWQSPRTGRP